MVAAVLLSHAEEDGTQAKRRHAKNYYRNAFMARRLRVKVSLLEAY